MYPGKTKSSFISGFGKGERKIARKSRRRAGEQEKPDAKEPEVRIYKAGLYARLSADDTYTKSRSLTCQIEGMRHFVETQPDLIAVKEYKEDGKSGTSFFRPVFQSMLEDARQGIIDCILVKDFSRFGRNYKEAGKMMYEVFPDLGIRFISVNDGYDSLFAGDGINFFQAMLKNLFHDLYAKNVSRLVKSSYEADKESIRWFGVQPPYGYCLCGKGKKDGLAIEKAAADFVVRIYEWYLMGLSYDAIARRLNEMGAETPYQHQYGKKTGRGQHWRGPTIKNILSNPVYTGKLYRNKTAVSYEKGQVVKRNPKGEWQLAQSGYPAVISEEVFQKAALETKRRETERRSRNGKKSSSRLS